MTDLQKRTLRRNSTTYITSKLITVLLLLAKSLLVLLCLQSDKTLVLRQNNCWLLKTTKTLGF